MKLLVVIVIFGTAFAGFDGFCSIVINEDGTISCDDDNRTRDDTVAAGGYCTTNIHDPNSVTCKGENITEIPNHLSVDIMKL